MRDTIVRQLSEMVAIDSRNPAMGGPPGGQRQLIDYLQQQAIAAGFATALQQVDAQQSNLIVSFAVASDRPWMAFDSHVDTVGVEGMTVSPFAPRVHGNRLYGRGSCDTKSSGAAMFAALCAYAADASRRSRGNNVVLTFTCDEEVAKTGVKALVRDRFAALPCGVPHGAVIGEPTGLRPIVSHGGVVRWAIETTGKAAHSSNPSLGRSAISMMAKVVTALENQYVATIDRVHPLIGHACCSINLISGGSAINVIPERCVIEIDRRIMPGESMTDVLPAVENVLQRLRDEHADLNVHQHDPFIDPPLDSAGSERFVAFVQKVLECNGLSTTAAGAKYGTHASQFAEAGVPAIVLGPGDIAQAHTADEWVDVDEVVAAAGLYLDLMATPLPREGAC